MKTCAWETDENVSNLAGIFLATLNERRNSDANIHTFGIRMYRGFTAGHCNFSLFTFFSQMPDNIQNSNVVVFWENYVILDCIIVTILHNQFRRYRWLLALLLRFLLAKQTHRVLQQKVP